MFSLPLLCFLIHVLFDNFAPTTKFFLKFWDLQNNNNSSSSRKTKPHFISLCSVTVMPGLWSWSWCWRWNMVGTLATIIWRDEECFFMRMALKKMSFLGSKSEGWITTSCRRNSISKVQFLQQPISSCFLFSFWWWWWWYWRDGSILLVFQIYFSLLNFTLNFFLAANFCSYRLLGKQEYVLPLKIRSLWIVLNWVLLFWFCISCFSPFLSKLHFISKCWRRCIFSNIGPDLLGSSTICKKTINNAVVMKLSKEIKILNLHCPISAETSMHLKLFYLWIQN